MDCDALDEDWLKKGSLQLSYTAVYMLDRCYIICMWGCKILIKMEVHAELSLLVQPRKNDGSLFITCHSHKAACVVWYYLEISQIMKIWSLKSCSLSYWWAMRSMIFIPYYAKSFFPLLFSPHHIDHPPNGALISTTQHSQSCLPESSWIPASI